MGACLRGVAEALLKGPAPEVPGFYVFGRLAAGGFAVVWRAERLQGRKQCALKSFDRKLVRKQDVARELAVMRMLSHAHVLSLVRHEVAEDLTHMHLVLELCGGGDLMSRMSEAKLSEAESRTALLQCLEALAYVHGEGVAHRDVKPENLLLARPGGLQGNVLKLADFGSAATFDRDAPVSLRGPAGTALYVAPEVFRGVYGPKCDLWSAGVVLYALLSGAPPFADDAAQRSARPAYGLEGKTWSGVSELARRLTPRLLQAEAGSRLSAAEAVAHAWFRDDSVSDAELSTEGESDGGASPSDAGEA